MALVTIGVSLAAQDRDSGEARDRPRSASDRVRSVAEFRTHVSRVRQIHVEILRLDRASLPFPVEVSMAPYALPQGELAALLPTLGGESKPVPRSKSRWNNRITFTFEDGSALSGGIASREGEPKIGLQLPGARHDVGVSGRSAEILARLLEQATTRMCLDRGIATARLRLDQMPRETVALRIFEHADRDLVALSKFPRLASLDLSGLRRTLDIEGLRHVARSCRGLEELILDGVRLPDDHLVALTNLVRLKRVSLRGVGDFTGSGFEYFLLSAKRRRRFAELDVGEVSTLTDAGLKAICRLDPERLVLDGSGSRVTRHGLEALEHARSLVRLDLRNWDLDRIQARDYVRALRRERDFVLVR